MTRKQKLIKIKINADSFFDLAEERFDDGALDYSLYYFFRAYQKGGGINALMAVGDTYAQMGRPKEALKYLFIALDQKPSNPEVCELISECFSLMDDDETAFFYIRPHMTVESFHRFMEESEEVVRMETPDIRVVEKNDEMIMGIAAKLIESGDMKYAREMLLTINPDSEYYVGANNILALEALENDKPDEALVYLDKAMDVKDRIDIRCTQLVAYHMLGDSFGAAEASKAIEKRKHTQDDHRASALAYMRIEDSEKALKHLQPLADGGFGYEREVIMPYALALYKLGKLEKAKQEMLKAHRTYPEDEVIKEFLRAMSEGRPLGLIPVLDEETSVKWWEEVDRKLLTLSETNDLKADQSFCEKINWVFSGRFPLRQQKAAAALAAYESWRPFLLKQLLNDDMETMAKKRCLYYILLFGAPERIGFVLYGLYSRLKVRYPLNMDESFRTAYCRAYSSFAVSDSGFESRLFKAANTLAEQYNAEGFDKAAASKNANALAACIFFKARHREIRTALQCSQIFGCELADVKACLELFGIKAGKKAETER